MATDETRIAAKHYQKLVVWQKAMDIAKDCYVITHSFPKEEVFGMTSQIRRSAASVAANIAEGQGRSSTRDFLRFLSMAKGSLSELKTFLLLCQRVGLLNAEQLSNLMSTANEIGRMLSGLRKALTERDEELATNH